MMDYRGGCRPDVMMDDDSRDSGVSVSSNVGQFDASSSPLERQRRNGFDVKASEVDATFVDLKIDEVCMDLDELEWSANELLKGKAALNESDPRTPHAELASEGFLEGFGTIATKQSPKSRWEKVGDFIVSYGLNMFSDCPTSFADVPTNALVGSEELGSSRDESSKMELCWLGELKMTVSDVTSVFNEGHNSEVRHSTGSRLFGFDAKRRRISVRRTQSDSAATCKEGANEMRDESNEDPIWGGDAPLCGQRTVRKRTHSRPVDSDSGVIGKKMKTADGNASDQQLQVCEKTGKKAPRRSSGIQRALSSGILERGPFAKVHEERLPKPLEVEYSLQTVSHPQVDSGAFKSISAETLIELLTKMDEEHFTRRFLVIDCRYPYEYQGGHVKGAINIHDPGMVSAFFFPNDTQQFDVISQKIPIFYCEYSQKRGPAMAYALRAHDRKVNEMRYPEVFYKEIYLVDYGYRRFYQLSKFMGLCEPNAYVTMTDECHVNELRSFRFHRSRSVNYVDRTLSRGNRPSRRPVRFNHRLGLKNMRGIKEIAPLPQDDESPIHFIGVHSMKKEVSVEEEQDLVPLPKLNFY